MTRTDDRLRDTEWALAREEQARSTGALLRVRTHELLNLVQIVDLASQVILDRCGAHIADLVEDLRRAADDARVAIRALQDMAQPVTRAGIATGVGDVARRVPEASVRVRDGVSVAWTGDELEMLLHALAREGGELVVRDRAVEDGTLVEVLCGPVDSSSLAVRHARAAAALAGGEVTLDPRRGGGNELVIAIPATVPARAT